jgi:hypothetical protein
LLKIQTANSGNPSVRRTYGTAYELAPRADHLAVLRVSPDDAETREVDFIE